MSSDATTRPSDPGETPPSEQGAPVRVLVADDHPMWREAVARDLEDAGYQVVATAANGAEAVRRAAATSPQVVLADLQMPGVDGVEATRQIVAADPRVRVLVLSASGEQADVLEAVKAGATGYLVKSASREELLDAVGRTAQGDTVFTPGLAGLVLGEFRRMSTEPAVDPSPGVRSTLTERETEVLRLLADARSNAEIATALYIGEATVKTHVSNVLQKLGARDRVAAVVYAHRHGLT